MYIKGDTIHCYLQNLSSDDIMVSVALEKKIDSEWIDIIEDVLDITNDGLYKRKMAMTIAPESQQTLSTAINDVVVKKINAGIFRFKFYIIECNKEKTKYFRHSTEFKIGRVESDLSPHYLVNSLEMGVSSPPLCLWALCLLC